MKLRILSVVFLFTTILSGCGIGNDLSSAYNMTQCQYDYNSISNLRISGMNLSDGISPLYIPKILAILSGNASNIPLDFTLNLNVKNPNATNAALNSFQYIINIDDVEFTSGNVNHPINIAAGTNQVLPLSIGVDLASLMRTNSKSAIENMAKNFIGIGDKKSNVTVQIKPTFMMGNTPIVSPIYIPVSFSFGGH